MKSYPSIEGSSKDPREMCYSFCKYDGSSMRSEWSPKRGWYKFGTRNCMTDENDVIFGRGVKLFKEKYAGDLEKVFKSEKFFRGVQSVVVFFEFFGEKSFAGMHFPEEQKWDVVLFDVSPHKKGIIGPKEFVDLFGHLKVAELINVGNLNEELIESVKNGTLDCESKYEVKTPIPEGIVCKGGSGKDLWMCKIKTSKYRDELRKRYEADWEKHWDGNW